MKTYLSSLRPQERRLVVGVGLVTFVVLNLWLVVPHFSDWQDVAQRREQAEKKLAKYTAEIAQMRTYEARIKELSNDAYQVPDEDRALHFQNEIQSKAAACGIILSGISHMTENTNKQFFLEKSITITATTKEKQLVDFLYELGSSNSMIRVRDLGLSPDPPRQQLRAQIKLVASYQKTPPAKTAGSATKSSAPAPKAASPASKRPNTLPRRS
jgi:Tfp pilus assembly protein PilO